MMGSSIDKYQYPYSYSPSNFNNANTCYSGSYVIDPISDPMLHLSLNPLPSTFRPSNIPLSNSPILDAPPTFASISHFPSLNSPPSYNTYSNNSGSKFPLSVNDAASSENQKLKLKLAEYQVAFSKEKAFNKLQKYPSSLSKSF